MTTKFSSVILGHCTAVSSQIGVLSQFLELKNIQSGIGLRANPLLPSDGRVQEAGGYSPL